MRVQSFQQMLSEYEPEGLESDDLKERENLLSKYKYSVIVELGFMELDNLEKWMKLNITTEPVEQVWYGKTGYDFGFAEFFFNEEEYHLKLIQAVPNIYTVYPNSYPPGKTTRSVGYNEHIEYDPSNKDAIILKD